MTVTCERHAELAELAEAFDFTPCDAAVLTAYVACVNEARGDGRAWLSWETLTKRTRFSRKSVARSLARLREWSILTPVGRTPGRADRSSVIYAVSLRRGVPVTPRAANGVSPCPARGVRVTPEEQDEEPVARTARVTHDGTVVADEEQGLPPPLFDRLIAARAAWDASAAARAS